MAFRSKGVESLKRGVSTSSHSLQIWAKQAAFGAEYVLFCALCQQHTAIQCVIRAVLDRGNPLCAGFGSWFS